MNQVHLVFIRRSKFHELNLFILIDVLFAVKDSSIQLQILLCENIKTNRVEIVMVGRVFLKVGNMSDDCFWPVQNNPVNWKIIF
jgi:hypothetical protein